VGTNTTRETGLQVELALMMMAVIMTFFVESLANHEAEAAA
jgi:hypothetical protein